MLEKVVLHYFGNISFDTNDTNTIQIILTLLQRLCYFTVFITLFSLLFFMYVAARLTSHTYAFGPREKRVDYG